jgi:hypothetical protein
MLDRAVASGASVEVLERLMGLQERWERNAAKKAFDAAVSAAKAEIPVVAKNQKGHNNKLYADFSAFARAVDPIIAKHSLYYRFRTTQEAGSIKVACVLSHAAGHSEENSLAAGADTSGSKNAIQAIGSTLTYLQRYTLVQALGLAASEDDDGHAAGIGETITDAQLAELQALADDVKADVPKFCAYLKVGSLADIKASGFAKAKAALEAKRGRA